MWPFKPRPILSSACPPVRPSARLADCQYTRPFVRASWALSAPLLPVRMSAPRGLRPPVSSTVCTLSASVRPPFRPTALSAPVRPSARPLRARIVRHIRPPRPPRVLRLRETTAAIYTPPRLPSDHPAPRSPRWAPSLCCTFKDCGTTRGSRTSGGWSELRGKPLQFSFCAASSMERKSIYIQEDQTTAAAESPRLITNGGSEAGIETPITITSGGSHNGHVVDSRGPMRELIPLGRSSAANPKDFARPRELQAGQSTLGGRRGG